MTYKPKDTMVVRVWKRLSPEDRETRLFHARRRLELIKALDERMDEESERSAAIRLKAECDRTTIRRWRERYEKLGLDGLIDLRIGHCSSMPDEIQVVICTLRRINPAIDVETIVAYVKEHHGFMTSGSTVKRVLSEHGLNRRPGPQKGSTTAGEQRMELGGMKLLEAACAETGYVEALARAIVTHVQDLPGPETPEKPDMSGRDEYSRFLPEYNERYRKKPGTSIGPGFASVSEKRKRMNPGRLEISKTREAIIERKLLALLASPIIGGGRWDSMRVSRADKLLKEVCGFPYMPATLDRFSRELKYAGVANTLWEVHARFWFAESSGWGDERRATVLYVDGTTKPIRTRLFSQSTKISQLGRTMPGLELVAFHTGYGVPLWMLTHSGRAPLVRVVPEAVSRLEEICGSSSVGRLLVIDAEANSVPFLKGLEQGKPSRAWVTRLREDWVRNRKIFNRTNYRKYRSSDRVRMGVADFNDPDGGTFRMRVAEVERISGKVTYLGASMMLNNREWKAADIADLYFDRWPEQEANFRAVSRATGFKDVHGYGKQLTDNISVVTEIDELFRKIRHAEERLTRQQNDVKTCERKVSEEKRILGQKVRRQEIVRHHIEAHLVIGRSVTPALQELVNEQRFLANEIARRIDCLSKCRQRYDKTKSQVSRTQARLSGYREQKEKLESRRKIFAHDVELDSLFSLLKVGLVLMVTYVLREYLGNACMDVLTFLERVVTLPARLRITP
ncbi:MAG: hypothetical protein GY820_18905, partial [Gammaproteobacteria bacterium]|nr:hypothetical protein [Gammaproteobacteria bacterium]